MLGKTIGLDLYDYISFPVGHKSTYQDGSDSGILSRTLVKGGYHGYPVYVFERPFY